MKKKKGIKQRNNDSFTPSWLSVSWSHSQTRNWNFVNTLKKRFEKKNRKRTMHFLPWMDGENRGWKLTPRWNVTDSHRGKDFLMVSIGSWSFSNKRRLIGRRLPYPSKKGGPFQEEPVPPRLGNGGWTSAVHGVERWRTRTKDVRCLPPSVDPFVRSYSTGAEVKTKPLPPLSPVDLLSPVCHPPSRVNQG